MYLHLWKCCIYTHPVNSEFTIWHYLESLSCKTIPFYCVKQVDKMHFNSMFSTTSATNQPSSIPLWRVTELKPQTIHYICQFCGAVGCSVRIVGGVQIPTALVSKSFWTLKIHCSTNACMSSCYGEKIICKVANGIQGVQYSRNFLIQAFKVHVHIWTNIKHWRSRLWTSELALVYYWYTKQWIYSIMIGFR